MNEEAIRAAVLNNQPYDYAFVPNAVEERYKEEVLLDAPVIPHRGSYGLPSLRRGPKFEAVIQDLLSDRFRHIVEEKFDLDLSNNPPVIVMMGQTSGAYNEGYAHPDSKHKIVTVLLGFSREWPYELGKLRILNSPDREDFAFEYPPRVRQDADVPRQRQILARLHAAERPAHELAALLLQFRELCEKRVSAAQAQRLCEIHQLRPCGRSLAWCPRSNPAAVHMKDKEGSH